MEHKPIEDWSMAVEELASHHIPLFFAGRILTDNGANFLKLCIERNACSEIGIVDNGFTILSHPELLPHYKTINISIDGFKEDHDKQRGKAGAFDRAWGTISELKKQGFDPVVSSAISPLTVDRWYMFEDLLSENDVPLSSTIVWALPNPLERGKAIFADEGGMIKAFNTLLNGVPKLINIYSFEQVKTLWPILRTLEWKLDTEVGDCLSAEIGNGTTVIYRPTSSTSVSERSLEWDGVFYTPFTYGRKMPVSEINQEYTDWVKERNLIELGLWSSIL
jgi:hypothetical protein